MENTRYCGDVGGVQIEIEMKNNINSINIDSRNIKNAPNKLVLKPAQNIFLIK